MFIECFCLPRKLPHVLSKLIPGLTSKATTNVISLPVLEFHINGYKWYILSFWVQFLFCIMFWDSCMLCQLFILFFRRMNNIFFYWIIVYLFIYWSIVDWLESPLDCKEIKSVNLKGNQPWIFNGRTDAEAEAPILWPPYVKIQLIGNDLDAGKDWGQKEERATEHKMVR